MKKNNLVKNNVMKRPTPTTVKERRKYYRNLLARQFNQEEPNKVWVSDFLEININGVKFYLCVILDLFSRKVIAWRLSHKISENLAVNTFKDAFEIRNEPIGLMFHSDHTDPSGNASAMRLAQSRPMLSESATTSLSRVKSFAARPASRSA